MYKRQLDAGDDEAGRWLLACVFADQPRRADRLRAALAIARRFPPPLVRADGPAHAAELALAGQPEMHPVVWHSAALVYTYESQQRAMTESLDRAGAATDLTWIFLEGREGRAGLPPVQISERAVSAGFALVAVSYRGGERSVRQLAGVDPHGATMQWLA